ncbi:MAG: hypothetical protein V3U92_08055 [Cellulophaga sp.]
MKNSILVFAILLFTTTISCKEEKKTIKEPTKMEQVVAAHDELMPLMSTIGSLISDLNKKLDSTKINKKYTDMKTDLQDSNTAMMDWMKGFGDRFDTGEILNGKELSEEKKKWLDEEAIKVKALQEQMHSSIKKAKELLGN